ncbi:unnamed protein product [Rotaria sordida]|uniref:Uncharacterized protein n=1 Tax=Rotaria sordida TaxID=392033 RepID=A0A814GPM1_9BILA|nr:unnamed protein product [Rotaria sordida]
MNILIFLLVFLISTMKIVQCDLSMPSLLVHDPFDNPYLKAILRMDIKALMKIPILDDDTFISQFNKSNSDVNGITGLSVTQTDSEREAKLKMLAQETLSTSAKVSRMALERKQQYEQRNHARQEEYNRFIQQITLNELESGVGK